MKYKTDQGTYLDFQEGDKVECVLSYLGRLHEGHVYTVLSISVSGTMSGWGVMLMETPFLWCASRFKSYKPEGWEVP